MKQFLIASLLVFGVSLGTVQAQRVSATLNVSGFDIDKVSSGNTSIDYKGSTSLSGNLRLYTKNKWAFRFGAGVDNLNYTVSNGIQTDYDARRQDLKGIFGVEKHFMLGPVDIYPGAYIPVTVVGEEIIQDNLDSFQNGEVRGGLGLLLGANLRLLKILRLGVEFDANYDSFEEAIGTSVSERSLVPIQGLNYTTNFTIGVAF